MRQLTIKTFNRAKKIHDDIVALDAEIIQIEKLANEAANDKCKLFFNVKTENYTQAKKEKKEILTEDNSLSSLWYHHLFTGIMPSTVDEINHKSNEYKFEFNDSECLLVLSIILKIKQERRSQLMSSIVKLGISI